MSQEGKEVLAAIAAVTLCLAGTGLILVLRPDRVAALTILVMTLASVYSLYYWLNDEEEQ